ncbi:MAG: hypothetical protein AAFY56_11425 [Pseudomonadota bacterium]
MLFDLVEGLAVELAVVAPDLGQERDTLLRDRAGILPFALRIKTTALVEVGALH